MFKNTTLAVLGLTFSSMAAAGSMGPVCTPGNVSVPCENRAWDFSVDALYLQPTLTNESSFYGSNIINGTLNFEPYDEWNWGFKLGGSYHFGTGKDMTLNWYHLNSKNSYSNITDNPGFTSQMNFKWDAVNAELAQFVDFSADKKIRFHGGVAYARISSEVSGFQNGVLLTDSNTWGSYFSGFGPRTGVDLDYVFGNGFGIYTKAAAALLVGSGSFHICNDADGAITSGNRNPVIPEIDAKLGGMYTYGMAEGNLTLDAGWMWASYLQAQHQAFGGCDSNFSISGPYVGLNYIGNL